MKNIHIIKSNTDKYKFTLSKDRITIKEPNILYEYNDINRFFINTFKNFIVEYTYRGNIKDDELILKNKINIIKINFKNKTYENLNQ